MKQFQVTASYANCSHNFILSGIPSGSAENDRLTHSLTSVIKNILQRSPCVRPSKVLRDRLGDLPDCTNQLYMLAEDTYVPQWRETIKGAENGDNPACEFFYEFWEEKLPEFNWVRQLIIPEAALDKILDDDSGQWNGNCVDFYIPQVGVVIEIDGAQHKEKEQEKIDKARDNALRNKGITILRIPVRDIRDRDGRELDSAIRTLSNKLKESALNIYNAFNEEKDTENYNLRMKYELVMRFEMLFLALVEENAMGLFQSAWDFNIDDRYKELFLTAAEDVFAWYSHLFGVRGIDFHAPAITFSDHGMKIESLPFMRPDDVRRNAVCIMTDPWDGYDYFRVSCAELIDYKIEWPLPENSSKLNCLEQLLEDLFSYEKFREGQLSIVVNLLNLKRTIGILPTGGGKSLCYQFACLLQPAMSFAVCPIMALQKDQKDNLDQCGVSRTQYISGLNQTPGENQAITEAFSKGDYLILWLSPERFQTPDFRKSLDVANKQFNFAYAVIDEVHCLSEWGHDFRTSYLTLIPTIEKFCPQATLVGLTATASSLVLNDLKQEFHDNACVRATATLKRENLILQVRSVEKRDKLNVVQQILSQEYADRNLCEKKQGIIFSAVRDTSDQANSSGQGYQLAGKLRKEYPDLTIETYHSGKSVQEKLNVQKQFMSGNINILSATKAFGVGMNKSNVRYTVHYGLPWSVESFYQEAGRAGRDGDPANCYIVYQPEKKDDRSKVDRLFSQYIAAEEIQNIQKSLPFGSDIGTLFFLWGRNNKGIERDLKSIQFTTAQLRDRQNWRTDGNSESFYVLSASAKEGQDEPGAISSADTELALYRLKLLGVVSDWMIEFHPQGDNLFSVYLNRDISEPYVKDHLLRYIKRADRDFSESRSEDQKYFAILNEQLSPYYIDRYAKALIAWTYDHVIYSRRVAIGNMKRYCEEFTTPENLRNRIEDFLAINEHSAILDSIVSGETPWNDWFEVFYARLNENGTTRKALLTPEEFGSLRDLAARYRESYNLTGLNLIYTISGAASGRFDMNVDSELFDNAIRDVFENRKPDSAEIINRILGCLQEYRSYIGDSAAVCFSKGILKCFPEMLEPVYNALDDDYSLALMLESLTKEIQNIAGGATWQRS